MGGNIFKVNGAAPLLAIGRNQQIDDIISIMNYQEKSITEDQYRKQTGSLYASASVGYLHTYFLEGTLRGDKSSTLPTDNNVYVYPSVSGSMVFSELIKNSGLINYGKVRASWARVGSDTDPYQLQLNYTWAKDSYAGRLINAGNIQNRGIEVTC